jgi:hypothetical protein
VLYKALQILARSYHVNGSFYFQTNSIWLIKAFEWQSLAHNSSQMKPKLELQLTFAVVPFLTDKHSPLLVALNNSIILESHVEFTEMLDFLIPVM